MFPFFLLYGPSWGPFGWATSRGRQPLAGRLVGWGFLSRGFVEGAQVEHPKPKQPEVRPKKNSYVSAVAGGQKKSHPGGRDCFFFGFFEIKATFYNLH